MLPALAVRTCSPASRRDRCKWEVPHPESGGQGDDKNDPYREMVAEDPVRLGPGREPGPAGAATLPVSISSPPRGTGGKTARSLLRELVPNATRPWPCSSIWPKRRLPRPTCAM